MKKPIMTIRAVSGLSGDMLLAGLTKMCGLDQRGLDNMVLALGMDALSPGCVTIGAHSVNHIGGWRAFVDLPHEHAHRAFADIERLIGGMSAVPPAARELALKTFALLAEAEGRVHGVPACDVTFHEVGALDSIVDICLGCMLFEQLGCALLQVSPLPLADGSICCAHGVIPSPAPAVLQMLDKVRVCSFAGQGETVTPTALALLKSWGAVFGGWPSMEVERTALVYGSKVFEGAHNGAIFALGYGDAEGCDNAAHGGNGRESTIEGS